jgi:hypothetical protein
MPKSITSQELDQCFRELLRLRDQVQEAELGLAEAAKPNLKSAPKSVVRQAAAPVVLH